MLNDAPVMPTIPASDLERAKDFYENKLGLKVDKHQGDEGTVFNAGNGTKLFVYKSAGAGTSQATYASFWVSDLEATMEGLRAKGVVFEEYDMPGLKTVNGIATHEHGKAAWFKDSEGNILGVDEM